MFDQISVLVMLSCMISNVEIDLLFDFGDGYVPAQIENGFIRTKEG